jgi:hypothetical protein
MINYPEADYKAISEKLWREDLVSDNETFLANALRRLRNDPELLAYFLGGIEWSGIVALPLKSHIEIGKKIRKLKKQLSASKERLLLLEQVLSAISDFTSQIPLEMQDIDRCLRRESLCRITRQILAEGRADK